MRLGRGIVLMLLVGLLVAPARAATISVDGNASGARFGGVGAVSGGGGNARYLIDYPPAQRHAILDELFKPGYGAALQVLKVEIGGDADSTDGAEASIEHTAGAIDCGAGYEWWLMREAKRRDPAIRLYALAWAAPGWTARFWSPATIGYIVDWMRCARAHGLHIDYLGGTQNEGRSPVQYDLAWTESLRGALDAAGFASTRIAMSDAFDALARWAVADDVARDAAFRAVTGIVASHDVCGYPTNGLTCSSTPTARGLGLPLWASELGGVEGDAGAAGMARAIIRGYTTAGLVGFITWPIASAMPPGVPHPKAGIIDARQPWSGHYRVRTMAAALGMVSWFTAPGWRYVDGANGLLADAAGTVDGAYAALRSPSRHDWSVIAETTTAARRIPLTLAPTGGLPRGPLHVWRSDLASREPQDWMVPRGTIRSRRGRLRFSLRPGFVYSLSTLDPTPAAHPAPPRPRPFAGYVDHPRAVPVDDAPAEVAPMDGAFAHEPCWGVPARTCIEQMAPQAPIFWHAHPGFPYAVIGDTSLRDYVVGAGVRFRDAGSSAGVIVRFSDRGPRTSDFRGYLFDVGATGRWALMRDSRRQGVATLAAGTLGAAAGVGTWHRIALAAQGSVLTASVQGTVVASMPDGTPGYSHGIAGVEAGASVADGAFTGRVWPVVQYRNLRVDPLR